MSDSYAKGVIVWLPLVSCPYDLHAWLPPADAKLQCRWTELATGLPMLLRIQSWPGRSDQSGGDAQPANALTGLGYRGDLLVWMQALTTEGA